MTGIPQSMEGAVLAAALDDDAEQATALIMSMYPLERATLAAACDRVADLCQRHANSPIVDAPEPDLP